LLSCHHVRRRSTEQDFKVSWGEVGMVGGYLGWLGGSWDGLGKVGRDGWGGVGMVGEELGWLGRSWDGWGGVGMVGEELGWLGRSWDG